MPMEYFEQRERALLGDRFDVLYAAPQETAERGVTVSALRSSPEQFAAKADFPLEASPFCKAAFVVHQPDDLKFRPGRHPYHHAGVFYSQEPSASSAAPLLGVQPGMRVLDMCAAPGGKSSQLAAALQGRGVLVSNEYVAARADILKSNLERMGVPNAVVLNETPARIADALPEFFDRVLVDAPCSGEGMFRKEPVARQQHCEALVKQCAELGAEILDCAAAVLAPGGQLVYSTCTFAPVENEGSISWILEQCPEMELIPIEGYEGFSEGNPAWGDGREELRRCVRIWPHKMKGEGHFLALLKKSEDAPETRIRLEPPTRMDKKNKAVLEEFFKDCQWKPDWERVQIKGEKVYLVPELPAKLNGIHFLRNGLYLGDLKKNRFEPSQQLAMTLKASDYAGSVSLSPEDERIGRYLRGETLLLEPEEATREKGWILVCVDQYALGWGKLVNGVLKNKYWSGWRLKS